MIFGTGMTSFLFGVSLTLETVWVLLIMTPVVDVPRGLTCTCVTFRNPHLISRGLLMHAVLAYLLAFLTLVTWGVIWWWWGCFLVHGTWVLQRWWKHTKNGRKKLLERIRGRVRDLGWRLVVEPEGAT